ncbi:hypothetical protein ABTY59_32095 [Streptomyces sp. NPDC096079]|uniref:hypothetical protein n=1 Tax=Streptomyces sp. NPDC096079 TaxID=3155820 RepID=UPI00332A5CCD
MIATVLSVLVAHVREHETGPTPGPSPTVSTPGPRPTTTRPQPTTAPPTTAPPATTPPPTSEPTSTPCGIFDPECPPGGTDGGTVQGVGD